MFKIDNMEITLEAIKSKDGREFPMVRASSGGADLIAFVNTTRDGERMFAGDIIRMELDHGLYTETLQAGALAADGIFHDGVDLETAASGTEYAIYEDENAQYRAFPSRSNKENTNVYFTLKESWGDAAGLSGRITVMDSQRNGERIAYAREADGKAILDASFVRPERVTNEGGKTVRAITNYQRLDQAEGAYRNARLIDAINSQLA